ncbi:hypothetical protein EAG_06060 [Camponotus floridanus]|uniref:Uncharacterized protein n=1 Tax=Camponotus floridanus TaxID=104421 RepID=E1ZZQ3_CAMFO|nr:hypothetical protein EAG_06060 [Camponotus floridanus]
MERKVLEMEKREKKERAAKGGREDTGVGSVERKIREMERKIEMKERKGKKRNILIRGMEVREERRKEMVEETMRRSKGHYKGDEKNMKGQGEGPGDSVGKARERRAKEGGINEKEQSEGQERENHGGLDVEGEKNEMEIRGDSEEGGERGEESEDRLWEDKDWERMVEVGRRRGSAEGRGREGERRGTGGGGRGRRHWLRVEKRGGKEKTKLDCNSGRRGGSRGKMVSGVLECGRSGGKDKKGGKEGLKRWEVIVLVETWMDERGGGGLVEEKVERIRIGDKVDSDHHPIEV